MINVIKPQRTHLTHKRPHNESSHLLAQFKSTTESLRLLARNNEQHQKIDLIVNRFDNEGLSRENRLAAIKLFNRLITEKALSTK